MPKRRREDQEESIETGNVDQGDFSDGEDESGEDGDGEDTDKYRLKSDDIEGKAHNTYIFPIYISCAFEFIGQEDPTLEFDGEVKITPFNMEVNKGRSLSNRILLMKACCRKRWKKAISTRKEHTFSRNEIKMRSKTAGWTTLTGLKSVIRQPRLKLKKKKQLKWRNL